MVGQGFKVGRIGFMGDSHTKILKDTNGYFPFRCSLLYIFLHLNILNKYSATLDSIAIVNSTTILLHATTVKAEISTDEPLETYGRGPVLIPEQSDEHYSENPLEQLFSDC